MNIISTPQISNRLKDKKQWFSLDFAWGYYNLALWTIGVDQNGDYRQLFENIVGLYSDQSKSKNLRFLFYYFNDCYCYTQFFVAGQKYTDNNVRVSLDSYGLPKILPFALRSEVRNSNSSVIVAVTTLLGIYSVIPWWPNVDLTTILDPFSGLSTDVNSRFLKAAKFELDSWNTWGGKINLLTPKFLLLRSASPNGDDSVTSVLDDAFAFYSNPRHGISLLRWLLELKAFGVLACLIFIWIFGLPVYLYMGIGNVLSLAVYKCAYKGAYALRIISKYSSGTGFWVGWSSWVSALIVFIFGLNPKSNGDWTYVTKLSLPSYCNSPLSDTSIFSSWPTFNLGKLGVIYNVAGKARVIGITNYWIQVALKPVHDGIMNYLSGLNSDGTFNQLKPIMALAGQQGPYSSFDLSAATDSLPLDVQESVLSLFIGRRSASLWRDVISFPLIDFEGDEISYAVGQPMGAYSSWASLAITHHVLVMDSILSSGVWKNESSGCPLDYYAVLGDDMVIRSDLGVEYLNTMQHLGVSISLTKSFVASDKLEFAKSLYSLTGDDYSILGPGLIIQGLSNIEFSAVLLIEAWNSALIDENTVISKISQLRGRNASAACDFGLNLLLGPGGLLRNDASFGLLSRKVGGLFLPRVPSEVQAMVSLDAWGCLVLDKLSTSSDNAYKELEMIWPFIKAISSRYPVLTRYFVRVMLLCSPCWWLPLRTYGRQIIEPVSLAGVGTIEQMEEKLNIPKLSQLSSLSVSDLNDMTATIRRLQNYSDRALSELSWDDHSDGLLHVW